MLASLLTHIALLILLSLSTHLALLILFTLLTHVTLLILPIDRASYLGKNLSYAMGREPST